MLLDGKRIIVTGISKYGMGYQCCKTLTKLGAKVAGIDRKIEDGEALSKQINNMRMYKGDVRYKEEIDKVIQQATDYLGGLDALVHAAAIHQSFDPECWQPADIDEMMKNNFEGTVFVDQAACKEMKKNKPQQGCILNFASLDAFTGADGIYGGSKAAVMSWTRAIAHNWAQKYNIRANSILPTALTGLYKDFLDTLNADEKEKFWNKMKNRIPLTGKPGRTEDIANYVAFLVSDKAKFVNGALIEIDGGQCMLRG